MGRIERSLYGVMNVEAGLDVDLGWAAQETLSKQARQGVLKPGRGVVVISEGRTGGTWIRS